MAGNSKAAKKNFGLINENGEEIGNFTGTQPRDAALKVANQGFDKIVLREKGTLKLHYFVGKRELVSVPENAPAWIHEFAKNNEGKIYKANVQKFDMKRLEYTELKKNDKALFSPNLPEGVSITPRPHKNNIIVRPHITGEND